MISILHFELESVRNLCKSTLNALESLVDNIGVDHPFNNITQLMEDILGIDQNKLGTSNFYRCSKSVKFQFSSQFIK